MDLLLCFAQGLLVPPEGKLLCQAITASSRTQLRVLVSVNATLSSQIQLALSSEMVECVLWLLETSIT